MILGNKKAPYGRGAFLRNTNDLQYCVKETFDTMLYYHNFTITASLI